MISPSFQQCVETERANTGHGREHVPYIAACPCGCGQDVIWTGVRITHPDDAMVAKLRLEVAECPRQRVARAERSLVRVAG